METHDYSAAADSMYIRRIMRQSLLEREDEAALAKAWRYHGDEEALHQLILAYSRLVVSIATKFRHYGLPLGDLIQEGNIGIMQAASRFDPSREVRFSTYSVWWIRASIQDFILRNWSIVRLGTTSAHKSLFFKLRHLRARIGQAQGGALNAEGRQEIAASIGVNVADIAYMERRLAGGDSSLNAPVGEEGDAEAQDFLADTRPNPEQSIATSRDGGRLSCWLMEAMEELNDREKQIITRRRLADKGATLDELGRDLGVSKERVRQLETRALQKLRLNIESRIDSPDDVFFYS